MCVSVRAPNLPPSGQFLHRGHALIIDKARVIWQIYSFEAYHKLYESYKLVL